MNERKMLTGHTPELLRRKCEDFLARLAKRFGDMKGKIEISLYGPPGTGKTLLAMALAREAEAVFFHVRVTNVVAKGRGRGRARPGDHRGHAAGDRELSQDQGDHREDSVRAVLLTARDQGSEVRGQGRKTTGRHGRPSRCRRLARSLPYRRFARSLRSCWLRINSTVYRYRSARKKESTTSTGCPSAE